MPSFFWPLVTSEVFNYTSIGVSRSRVGLRNFLKGKKDLPNFTHELQLVNEEEEKK